MQVGRLGWLPLIHLRVPSRTWNWLTELSLHCQRNCTICISKQELKVWAFCVCVFCFCVGFIFVLFSFWFSITWNVWKLFNLNVGKKTGKALFLHKTSIPNSANESGTSYKWWEVIDLLEFRFSFYGLTDYPSIYPTLTQSCCCSQKRTVKSPPSSVSSKRFLAHMQRKKNLIFKLCWVNVQLGFIRNF